MDILNIEFKARSNRIDEQESILRQYNPLFMGVDHQVDTYFNVQHGRLKLREGNIENSLIYYERADVEGAKASNVILYEHPADEALKNILGKTLGILAVVDKIRKIYFIGHVKFHFDTVAGLGTFIEVEAIDKTGSSRREKLREACDYYASVLGVEQHEYVSCSYSDLLLRLKNPDRS